MACLLCALPPAAFWVGGLGGISAAEDTGLEKGQFRPARSMEMHPVRAGVCITLGHMQLFVTLWSGWPVNWNVIPVHGIACGSSG